MGAAVSTVVVGPGDSRSPVGATNDEPPSDFGWSWVGASVEGTLDVDVSMAEIFASSELTGVPEVVDSSCLVKESELPWEKLVSVAPEDDTGAEEVVVVNSSGKTELPSTENPGVSLDFSFTSLELSVVLVGFTASLDGTKTLRVALEDSFPGSDAFPEVVG